MPGQEAKFLAPLNVRDIPGVGKVMEQSLHALNVYKVGDLATLGDASWKNVSESGAWRWQGSRAARMREGGSTRKWAPIRMPSQSATNTRTTKTPPMRNSWKRH